MPITTIGSYITTMQEHDKHWGFVDLELGGTPETALKLPGNFGRSEFQVRLAQLQAAITGMEDLENERQLSTADRDTQKDNLRLRVLQFRSMVQGRLYGTRYVRGLPKTPRNSMAAMRFLTTLDDMASLWTRIDAETGLPDFTPPLLLAGNYSLAGFVADVAGLRAAFQAVTAAEQELDYSRQKRDDMLPEIRKRLNQYHDIVEGTFGQGHPLVGSLPDVNRPTRGGGKRLAQARYDWSQIDATTVELWVEGPLGVFGIDTLFVRRGTNELIIAASPAPGEVFKTTWSGVAISGKIDEVKLRNAHGKDVAEGVRDPTLPDPEP